MNRSTFYFQYLAFGTLFVGSSLFAQGGGSSSPLGVASDFDLFGLTGVRMVSSSVQGRLAGNKLVELTQFGLALDSSLQASDDVLVSGGHLLCSYGVVSNGNATAELSLSIAGSVMFRNSSMPPRKADILDFEHIRTLLKMQSGSLAFLPPNGDVELLYGVLYLTGSDPVRNIFSVGQSHLKGTTRLSIDIPTGSVALVNVLGGSWSKAEWGLEVLGVPPSAVLINAFEARDITLANMNLDASILAPRAILDIQQMHVDGNVVARFISMTNAHTTGGHLASGPWEAPSGRFAADESGQDAPDYSLIWTQEYANQDVALSLASPGVIEVTLDGISAGHIRQDRLSRLVFDGPGSFSHLTIDSRIRLPVELSGAAPVAMDDRLELAPGVSSAEIDVLANDLEGPFRFGPGAVQIVSAPSHGSAQVDLVSGVITYSLPPATTPFATVLPQAVQLWYVATDQGGNQSTPRCVWISLDHGLTNR
jgi:choice-of-anchor A domain-containing protein